MIKQLLVGATVIQIASVLYKEGLGKIDAMVNGLKSWMKEKNFNSIPDFRGKLNQQHDPKSDTYIRAQYIKSIAGID
jgi:dihydroorotate dehydrogenase (fumarate)